MQEHGVERRDGDDRGDSRGALAAPRPSWRWLEVVAACLKGSGTSGLMGRISCGEWIVRNTGGAFAS
jgi:hypothetical protein